MDAGGRDPAAGRAGRWRRRAAPSRAVIGRRRIAPRHAVNARRGQIVPRSITRRRPPDRGLSLMRARGGYLLAPSLVLLVVAFAIPVGMLVPTSVRPYVPLVGITSGFTLRHYTRLVTDSYYP